MLRECSKCVHLKDSDNSDIEEQNRRNLEAPRSLRAKRSDYYYSSSQVHSRSQVSSQSLSPCVRKKRRYVKKKDRLGLNETSESVVEKKASKRGRKKKIHLDLNDSCQSEATVKKFKAGLNDSVQANAPTKMRLNQLKTALNKSKSDSALSLKKPQVAAKNSSMLSMSIDENLVEGTKDKLNGQSESKSKKSQAGTDEARKSGASCNEGFSETIQHVISSADLGIKPMKSKKNI